MNPEQTIDVLHVDDEPDFADTAAAFLEREDDRLNVETTPSASDGLACLADATFDCVISDYDMPKMDGIEFLETVRKKYSALPFILYTGKGSEEVASDAIAAGASDYLQKERGTGQYTVLANRIGTLVERARAQRRQQQQLEAIETAREGIGILDSDGYYISVNQAYADIYRTEPEELIGEHWTTLYPEDEAEYVRAEIFHTVEEHGYWHGRTTGRRVDGTIFTQDCIISATEGDATICTVRDISDQIESEEQLNRYRTLVEALNDPVYVLDEDGQFQFVNESFVETFGYEFDEVIGSDVAIIKDEQSVEQGLNNLGRILSADGPDGVYFETEIRSKSGESIPCEDHMAVLPYEGESFNGSVGILRDISDRKQREGELERRNKRLDEFASIVSHDLRNPLNVAEGNLKLLREECESNRIDTVERALTRMDDLIGDLLQLARVGDQIRSVQSADLTEVANDCWQNVETAEATLQTGGRYTIQADRSRLIQLLENVFRNAAEHGGPGVGITVGGLADGFYIEDDGPGIPEDERDNVFDAGYTTTQAGTGFGLSIVSQIVEAHGWDIHITEGSNGGARFEFTGVAVDTE
ncbi:PAS domain S-box protein [Halorubrum sp. BOL3-1]|uniref:PAS domain S-box protein n=1 Tax=Halorubrum sp. BOL3-1 TaxID=2497325 RepID=UPI0010051957|nr:PAS domain S-box protein [Halorubrum sp. BOL3-1]QAU11980.1 PAS domain S-box protein [Halorubrum sp. BOL3-1]